MRTGIIFAKAIWCISAICGIATMFSAATGIRAQSAEPALTLEARIPLGDVSGRIDHMAIDPKRQRLFVAELGNNTVGVVDLKERKIVHVITGLKEPQGVAYVPSSDMIYVANAGDGSVRLFRAETYESAGRIDLGEDADNIRVDVASNQVFVGFGNGALAVIDPATVSKTSTIPLKGHPESFQLAHSSKQILVNVPQNREIAVVDRNAGKQTASWPLKSSGNFPMALDDDSQHVMVAFRSPSTLGVFSARDGTPVANVESCGDADDVFVDAKRHRVYMSCGIGALDVFDTEKAAYRRIARIPTVSGARTSLFAPEQDRLFLAARASAGAPAAIWIYRATP
jgi:DNA-binding beta-propeller fold protein YncE